MDDRFISGSGHGKLEKDPLVGCPKQHKTGKLCLWNLIKLASPGMVPMAAVHERDLSNEHCVTRRDFSPLRLS